MQSYDLIVRTTIELTNEQRARLLEMAARRGEKGFSRLVREAVDRYLLEEEVRRHQAQAARLVLGTLKKEDADQLLQSVKCIRETWR